MSSQRLRKTLVLTGVFILGMITMYVALWIDVLFKLIEAIERMSS